MGTSEVTSILIFEDHKIVELGLSELINTAQDNIDITSVSSYAELMNLRTDFNRFDLLIYDLKVPGNHLPLSSIESFIARYPDLKILVFTMYPEFIFAPKLYTQGIKGFLNKRAEDKEIIAAVRTILNGETYYSSTYRELIASYSRPHYESTAFDELNIRELEILMLLLKGYGSKEIAESTHMHISSVTSYKKRLFEKFNAKNLIELYLQVESLTSDLVQAE